MAKKQLEVPGLERPTFPDVDEAAESFVKAFRASKRANEKKKEAEGTLIEKLLKRKLESYVNEEEGIEIKVTHKSNVKVSKTDTDEEKSKAPAGDMN